MNSQTENKLNKYGDGFYNGTITKVNKTNYIIMKENKAFKGIVTGRFKYTVITQNEYPVVGDEVIFRMIDHSEEVVIEKVCDRRSYISRLGVNTTGEEQLLASNVDIAFICLSMNEDFRIKKLRNLLSLISNPVIETIILLTKSDLTEDKEYYVSQTKKVTSSKIITTSIIDDSSNEIYALLTDKTGVFIGSSGVGKSSLVNKLLNEDYLKVSGIRETDDQGRHTTSHRELIELKNGGRIIDTPGIRIIHNYHMDVENETFKKIIEYGNNCKFNDCTHTIEPGCKVVDAIIDGDVLEEDLEAFNKALKFERYARKRESKRARIKEKKRRN